MDLGSFGEIGATITGFVAVMAALSMVATGIAQLIQVQLRLRGRADMKAMVRHGPQDKAARRQREAIARRLLEASPLPSLRWDPGKSSSAPVRILVGVSSWLWRLAKYGWAKFNGPTKERPCKVDYEKEFGKDYEDFLERARIEHTRQMRRVGLVTAFGVAFTLQVSATHLLQRLSTDSEARKQALQLAAELDQSEAAATSLRTDEQIAEQAVTELAKAEPRLTARLEEWSGEPGTAALRNGELRLILAEEPDTDALVARYQELVQAGLDDREEARRNAAELSLKQLALLDISFDTKLKFYGKNGLDPGYLIGIIITGILLSFGAPFWYEKLRDLRAIGLQPKQDAATEPDGPRGARYRSRRVG